MFFYLTPAPRDCKTIYQEQISNFYPFISNDYLQYETFFAFFDFFLDPEGSFPYKHFCSRGQHGQLAQLVEHRLHTAGVTGSSPVLPTMHGAVVKSVITPACHAGGRGFKSLPLRHFLRTSFVEGVLFLCRCRQTGAPVYTVPFQALPSLPACPIHDKDRLSGRFPSIRFFPKREPRA